MPSPSPRRAVFFAKVDDASLLQTIEFYRSDIQALEALGYEVQVEHRLGPALRARGDVLFCWWWVKSLPVVVAWRIRGRPSIVTGATDRGVSVVPLHKRIVKIFLAQACGAAASHNLAISETELALLPGSVRRRSSVLYPGVDTDYFHSAEVEPTTSGVTVGQMYPFSIRRKGIDIAIAATEIVRRRIPEYQLNVAGRISTEGREWLASARDRWDFTGVNVLGEVSREVKRDLMRSAGLYLQPSIYDGFGVSMVEAMACGTPVICSAGGALPEVAAKGGRVIEDRTPEALAEAIIEVLSSPALRCEMGVAARHRAEALSIDGRVAGMRSVLDRVSSGGA